MDKKLQLRCSDGLKSLAEIVPTMNLHKVTDTYQNYCIATGSKSPVRSVSHFKNP